MIEVELPDKRHRAVEDKMSALEAVREDRRQRRTRETRRRILIAALELFGERGVDGVTVEEIADRADVARGTVFNHFASKENICQSLGELQVEMVREAIEDGRICGPTAGEKIAQAMRLMAEVPGQSRDHLRNLLLRALSAMRPGELPEHRRELFGLFTQWVEEGQRAEEFRGDVPSCALAGFMMGLQFQATVTWAYGFVDAPLTDYVGWVVDLALEGVRRHAPAR